MALEALHGDAQILAAAVLFDLLIGDPVYPFHPVRLIGRTLTWFEEKLRAAGFDGYGGGIALFVLLSVLWVGGIAALVALFSAWNAIVGLILNIFVVYSLLALHDLLRHAWAVEKAARKRDLEGAREAISRLVGRDTTRMDLAACRRAAIESLSENLTDGFVSPLFWYALAGLPGIVLFKVVSTMDSMVGYKTPQYFYFGWCGARLDDLMNWLSARITWLLIAAVAIVIPGCSPRKALLIGWQQHAILPGPNSGWSEAAIAGAIQRKLIGPIWANGKLVTEIWLGDPADPQGGGRSDIPRAAVVTTTTGLIAAALAIGTTARFH